MNKDILAFHYTSDVIAEHVIKGENLLKPSGSLVRYRGDEPHTFPSHAYDAYTFCLPRSPRPRSWTKNENFPKPFKNFDSWSSLMAGIFMNSGSLDGMLNVLALNLIESDEAYMVDFAEHDKRTWAMCKVPGYPIISEVVAWENYLDTLTPLESYENNYLLPELVIKNPINSNRIQTVGTVTLSSDHGPRFNWVKTPEVRQFRKLNGF